MKLNNEFLRTYLEYVESTTESPRIFHVWAALTSIGACLGRRCWYQLGRLKIFPNEYVLLVGPPGVRKSDAIGVIEDLLRSATNVRYAPEDTGGARQGLIGAMRGDLPEENEDQEIARLLESGDSVLDFLKNKEINLDDAHTMYVMADEFTTFIGLNSTDMITFLLKVYDGKDYAYKVKAETTVLHKPLLSLLGGTNPTALSQALPPSAIGGGFMSRTVLVYGNKRYKRLARPDYFCAKLETSIKATFAKANKQLHGPFEHTQQAADLLDAAYTVEVKIDDPRFIYYIERRHTHLIKLTQMLAGARGSMEIGVEDVEDALTILSETEKNMIEALGEFGMSPVGAAKQRLLEFVMHSAPVPVYLSTINVVMKRDMKTIDLMNSLMDLCNAGKIKQLQGPHGEAYIYIHKADTVSQDIELILDREALNGTSTRQN